MVADSGVPGSGAPLPPHVPCSIFRSALDSYWIGNGLEMIYVAWKHSLYNVDFEEHSKQHTCMGGECKMHGTSVSLH